MTDLPAAVRTPSSMPFSGAGLLSARPSRIHGQGFSGALVIWSSAKRRAVPLSSNSRARSTGWKALQTERPWTECGPAQSGSVSGQVPCRAVVTERRIDVSARRADRARQPCFGEFGDMLGIRVQVVQVPARAVSDHCVRASSATSSGTGVRPAQPAARSAIE
ncbi:hypothetical protein ACIP4Y_32895 [Streptomyces sp. NPDC088810]|uniref:hypothetical protein n=1 Tax=Streptomyces sp. NPDC088810 TaxID=3365904 RepID=UPI00382CA1F4